MMFSVEFAGDFTKNAHFQSALLELISHLVKVIVDASYQFNSIPSSLAIFCDIYT